MDVEDERALADAAARMDIEFGVGTVFLEGRDVTADLRAEEVSVPSLPSESMKTATPPAAVCPLMPAI